ncbi:MAG: hypothetical protein PHE67_11020 [Campylobacterales bacterium]|nr:hypothetical protein [Campylobacterales bacterium]
MKKPDLVFWLISIVAAASAFTTVWFYHSKFGLITRYDINATDKWGQFGDYVGGTLNPILGLLSLIVLLLVYVQNKEELELTRQELKNSATALAEQSKTLEIQRFEQTFFSLLELRNKITTEFSFNSAKGLVALKLLINTVSSYDDNRYTITRHCKIIIRIIEFLDHANISDKLLYSGLLRDSLINEELILLCREIIQIPEYEKIFKLLYKYGVFENFDFNNPNNFVAPHFKQLKQEIDASNKVSPDEL